MGGIGGGGGGGVLNAGLQFANGYFGSICQNALHCFCKG